MIFTMNEIMTTMMMMQTRILKNQEGCANTLSMECMDFYHRWACLARIGSPRYVILILPKVWEGWSELHKSCDLRLLL